MPLLSAVPPHHSSGVSAVDVLTVVGWVASVLYLLDLLGVLRWTRAKLPHKLQATFRVRPGRPAVVRILDVVSFALAVALVFTNGVTWKVGLASALVLAYAARQVIEIRSNRALGAETITESPVVVHTGTPWVVEGKPRPSAAYRAAGELQDEVLASQEAERQEREREEYERDQAYLSQLANLIPTPKEVQQAAQDKHKVDVLLKRGGALRVAELELNQSDELTRRYQPMKAALEGISRSARMFGPPAVNMWLEDVARFVNARCPEYSDRIVQRGFGGQTTPTQVVAAIDQNVEVLRLVKSELES